MLASIDSASAIVITNIIVGGVLTGLGLYFAYKQRESDKKLAIATAEQRQTSAEQRETSKHINEAVQETRVRFNSQFGLQMRVAMDALERLAAKPDATEDDKRSAREARRLYEEHMAGQAAVDREREMRQRT